MTGNGDQVSSLAPCYGRIGGEQRETSALTLTRASRPRRGHGIDKVEKLGERPCGLAALIAVKCIAQSVESHAMLKGERCCDGALTGAVGGVRRQLHTV